MKKEKKENEFELIDLDETGQWSKLEIEEQVQAKIEYLDEEDADPEFFEEPDEEIVYLQENGSKQEPVKTAAKKKKAAPKREEHVLKAQPHKKKKHTVKAVKAKKKKRAGKEESFFEKFLDSVQDMTMLDKLVAGTGVLVLMVAVITGSVYMTAKAAQKQVEAMAPIGEELELIGNAGENTLLAVADARKLVSEIQEEEESEAYEEKELDSESSVKVTMSLTSLQKDLKIKFINQKTKKLVSNVGFQVKITDADKKSYTKEDDDKDGIIYLSGMTPGKATVAMVELADNTKVSFDTAAQSVTIKEKIDYKKIDVSDEVKNESQVNAKAEDTAQANVVEAVLTDTVAWVESTKTEIGSANGYAEVSKKDIADPSASAAGIGSFLKTVETEKVTPSVSGNDPDTTTPTPTPTPTQAPTPSPTQEPSITPTPSPTAAPTKTVTPSPTVSPTPSKPAAASDTKTPLKDKSGNQLYIKDASGNYVEAKYADYFKNSKFYKKAGTAQYKYTGWQEIDGKTYFFDADGNKVTGEQVIQGAKYNFASDGALVTGSGSLGIDVSKWNGNINWAAVKNSGVSYVIIRCGYRGSSTGAMIEDPKFKANIQGASSAGLKVGIYFFSQAVNEVEAVEEASMTIGLIKNYRISYPVFLDVESSGGRADKIDSATRTNVITAYCQTIRNSGYTAGVYANKTWLNEKMNAGALSSYKIWLAQYNTAPTYAGKIDLWQYTSKGNVGGISGNTDMNLSYLGY